MNVSRSGFPLLWFMTGLAVLMLLVWWIGRPPRDSVDIAVAPPLPADVGRVAGRVPDSPAVPSGRRISGDWVGRLNVGAASAEFRFSLQESNGRLSGTVRFPVGDGVVQSGVLDRNQVSLVTVNPVPATGQSLRTQFSGTYAGDVMHLIMQTEAGHVNLTLQRVL